MDHPVWGRWLKSRFYQNPFEFNPHPDDQTNHIFASLGEHSCSFDFWPGINRLNQQDRQLSYVFGDGEELTEAECLQISKAYTKYGIEIPWKTGDVGIMCNFRFAHGRPPYSLNPGEKRELGVILGPFHTRAGPRPDAPNATFKF
jgi:hypothetical protein